MGWPKGSLEGTILTLLGFSLILFTPFWISYLVPEVEKLPSDFVYRAEVLSFDNFYDEKNNSFIGEMKSNTLFLYLPIQESEEKNILSIKNSFDVRTPRGEKIFAIDRLYCIDKYSLMHVPGCGDR